LRTLSYSSAVRTAHVHRERHVRAQCRVVYVRASCTPMYISLSVSMLVVDGRRHTRGHDRAARQFAQCPKHSQCQRTPIHQCGQHLHSIAHVVHQVDSYLYIVQHVVHAHVQHRLRLHTSVQRLCTHTQSDREQSTRPDNRHEQHDHARAAQTQHTTHIITS
jgi:hypothetical protein